MDRNQDVIFTLEALQYIEQVLAALPCREASWLVCREIGLEGATGMWRPWPMSLPSGRGEAGRLDFGSREKGRCFGFGDGLDVG